MGEIFQFRELVFEAGGYKHCFNFNWRTFDKIFGGGKKNNYAHSNVRWSLKLILKIPAINYFSSHAGLEKKKSNERREGGRNTRPHFLVKIREKFKQISNKFRGKGTNEL